MYNGFIFQYFWILFSLAQVNYEERLLKHDAFRSQKIAAFIFCAWRDVKKIILGSFLLTRE